MGIGFERIYLFLKTSQTTFGLVETESLSIAFIFEWLSCCFVFSSHYSVPTYFVMTLQLKIDLSSHKKDEDFVTGNAYLYDITGSLSKAVVGCSPKYM